MIAKTICLLGPSASGKTKLAIALAQKLNAQIISVDSVLVYKHLNIGSAKPSLAERQQIPHHLLDICDLEQEYNVANFVAQSHQHIKSIHANNQSVILAGGTMMYFNALLNGLTDMPTNTGKSSNEVDVKTMHQELKLLDYDSYQRLHPNDTSRIIRAWNVAKQGKNLSSYWQQAKDTHNTLASKVVILRPNTRQELDARISQRIDNMLDDGLIAEVQFILQTNPNWQHNPPKPLQTIGYKQVIAYLNNPTTLPELKQSIFYATRALVKRQTTWLKKFNPDVEIDCMLTLEQQLDVFVEGVCS